MQKAEMELHERLRAARIQAGYASAADAARRLAMPYGTYSGHENGQRGIRRDEIAKYARVFGVSRSWLEFGEEIGASERDDVELLGLVGKLPEGEVTWHEDPAESGAFSLPKLTDLSVSAIQVAGGGLKPFAYNNYLLCVRSIFSSDIEPLLDHVCACVLEDGRSFIRKPYKAGEGTYNLELIGCETIRDVKVERASPVLYTLTSYSFEIVIEENRKFVKLLREMAASLGST